MDTFSFLFGRYLGVELLGHMATLFFFFFFSAALGLCCCMQAFSSSGERGLLFVAVHGLLIAVASLVVEHRL